MEEESGPGLLGVPEVPAGKMHEEEAMDHSAAQSDVRHPSGDAAYQIAVIVAALLLIATMTLL